MTALIRKPTFVRSLCTQEYSTAELLSFTLLRDESLCMACVRTFNLFCFSILLLLLFKKKRKKERGNLGQVGGGGVQELPALGSGL